MTNAEIKLYFEENIPTIWDNTPPSKRAIMIESFALGFEHGKNQAYFEVKVGGCL